MERQYNLEDTCSVSYIIVQRVEHTKVTAAAIQRSRAQDNYSLFGIMSARAVANRLLHGMRELKT